MILALIQARMGSTRLPGKVMAPLNGIPMIEHIVHRVSRAELVNKVCVCTTREPEDDVLAAHVESLGVDVYRGATDDVLGRFYWAAERYPDADVVVRITGDDPFKDPVLIDKAVQGFLELWANPPSETGGPQYLWLGGITWPLGLDVEVFTRDALAATHQAAATANEREHVTPWMQQTFPVFRLKDERGRGTIGYRWTVDDVADLSFALRVYERLGNDFGYDDMIAADVEKECRP